MGEDVVEFAGFEGCASSREYYWHLAVDNEAQWDRFPDAFSYLWVPSDECDIRTFRAEELLKESEALGGVAAVQDENIVYMPQDTYINESIQTYTEFFNSLADALEKK